MRSGWVGGGVTDEKGGFQEKGGSGPPDPPSGHSYEETTINTLPSHEGTYVCTPVMISTWLSEYKCTPLRMHDYGLVPTH